MLHREEVLDWKSHPVTKELFNELARRVEGLKNEVVAGAVDGDPRNLAYKAGAIQALLDVLDTDI